MSPEFFDPPFFETVLRQRACRELSPEPVPDELIEKTDRDFSIDQDK